MKKCWAYFVFTSLLCFGQAGKLPSNFIICKRNDPDVEGCFAKAIEHALPLLKEVTQISGDREKADSEQPMTIDVNLVILILKFGVPRAPTFSSEGEIIKSIPSLGVPAIEPVEVKSLRVRMGTGAFSISENKTNVKVYNIINSKINKTELTLGSKNIKLTVYVYTKKFRLEADYELGSFLIPMLGKGKVVVNIDDLQTVANGKGEFYEKEGETYVKLHDVKVSLSPGKVSLNFENLFNGDESLGREANKLLNENWKLVFNDIKGPYEETFSAIFSNIFNAVLTRVPYDELFPL